MQNVLMSTWERINSELLEKKKSWKWLASEMGMTAQRIGHWKLRLH